MTQITEARQVAANMLTAQGRASTAALVLMGQCDDMDCVQAALFSINPSDPSFVPEPDIVFPEASFNDMGEVANFAGTADDNFNWPEQGA